ncbi:MAG: glycosyltransferase [Betaproteobacteria bacterium]
MFTHPSNGTAHKERPPVRLLTLTTLFPNVVAPRHGIFVANRLRRICDTGRVHSTVVAAVPWFPGAYRSALGVPRAESLSGFSVFHPRYFQVPGVGMRMQPVTLAWALLAQLRRQGLAASSFDIVDAHYFYPDGVAASRVADALGLPLVISARGSDINLIGGMPFARRRMLRAADRAQALVAVSAALAEKMAALGMPAERTHVLRNGVDMDVFSPLAQPQARAHLSLDERGPLVLGVGNLVAEKGFELLIRAVSLLPATRLLIVGQGPLRRALRSLGDTVAPGRVEFRDNMPQSGLRIAYAAADVLGLPSLREGWPNVLLEAMACGIPVVASAVGGVSEIVGRGAPGTVLSDRTAPAWATALRAMMGTLAPEQVRQYATRFGWEEVVLKQCTLYEEIADHWAAGSRPRRARWAPAHA